MALFTTIIGYWLQTVIRCLSGGLRNLRSAEKDIFSTQCLLSRMYLLAVRTIPSTLSLNKKKKFISYPPVQQNMLKEGPTQQNGLFLFVNLTYETTNSHHALWVKVWHLFSSFLTINFLHISPKPQGTPELTPQRNSREPVQQWITENYTTAPADTLLLIADSLLVSVWQKLQGAGVAGCQIDCPICVLTFSTGKKINGRKGRNGAEGSCVYFHK